MELKDLFVCEVEDKNQDNLIYGLADNLLIHVDAEQGGGLTVRGAIESGRMSGIGGKSESGKGVHDEINPQQLDSTESGGFVTGCESGDKCDSDGSNIDRKLELKEFFHGIIDASAPHDGTDNGSEIVIHKNNI